MKELIVTGGRNYKNRARLFSILNFLRPDCVLQGGAPGADTLAREWCAIEKVPCVTMEAAWDKHGKRAGPIRNREMLKLKPNALVVAFPGGAGTADCVKAAVELGRFVMQVLE